MKTPVLMTLMMLSSAVAAPLTLNLNLTVGPAPLKIGDTLSTPSGIPLTLGTVKLYVSEVALIQQDGSFLPIPGVRLLDFQNGQSQVKVLDADVPTGNYKGIRFSVGVPKELNHLDPTFQKAPLGVDSGMVWAWNPGYVFLKIEGKANLGLEQKSIALHLGTDSNLIPVNLFDLMMNKTNLAVPDAGLQVNVNLDVAKAFQQGVGGEVYDFKQDKYQQAHMGAVSTQGFLNLLGAFTLKP
ncbi:MbnP family protein [Deinococcus misasensis]|uniref:MbnP family protein n=1 Tax=Deinococcus misasensis TaxID=392413 RepID=UPI00054ED98F|nr:MbnP family protein [Deinococcus misasensis]